MKKVKVFVTRSVPEAGLSLLRQTEEVDLVVWPGAMPPTPEELRREIAGIHALYCLITEKIDSALLDAAAPHLKVISQMAVGYDNIDIAACTARGIPVGNTPGVLTEATADLTMALLLATARQLLPAAEAVKAGKWQTWEPMAFLGPDLYGSTVGIVGLGRIGLAVARRLQGFDVTLLYHNRQPHPQAGMVSATFLSLDDLLARSDFVIVLVALNEQTRHLINAGRLRQMKPSATLINVARGEVVDQEALLAALRDGVIARAGLDVTTPEPLPAFHPLLSLPNITILPHIGSASETARSQMARMAAENLIAGIRNQRLPHCVNPAVYNLAAAPL